jgi:KaiC/GvpD/RAD55 family RecA-like ATPase
MAQTKAEKLAKIHEDALQEFDRIHKMKETPKDLKTYVIEIEPREHKTTGSDVKLRHTRPLLDPLARAGL